MANDSGQRHTHTHTLVIGAGFSNSISNHAPLMVDLGRLSLARVGDELQSDPAIVDTTRFEAWLSRLAENQPDLTEAENLRNRYRFAKLATAVNEVIIDREEQILDGAPPEWLLRLLRLAHSARWTIITFNYDTLIEHTVMHQMLFDWHQRHRVTSDHIVDGLPPRAPGHFGTTPASTFRLLKLHGSTDTYWVPNDPTGATVNRWNLIGRWGAPDEVNEKQRQRELPGRSPLIVPPTATKSSYYQNPVIRQLWQQAATALSTADEVSLIGYSLPATDIVVSGMLAEQLASSDIPIQVVDKDPDPVRNRLLDIGILPARVKCAPIHDPLWAFVNEQEDKAARRLCHELSGRDSDALLLVAWSEAEAARIEDMRVDAQGERIELVAGEICSIQEATQSRGHSTDSGPNLGMLLSRRSATTKELVTVFRNGGRTRIIDHATHVQTSGAGNGSWHILVPVGPSLSD